MVTKRYRIERPLSDNDKIDVTIDREGGKITHFVLNYRARFEETGEEWKEVYRVDTCHGYLHEQKFWDTGEPIRIEFAYDKPLKEVFDEKINWLSKEYTRIKRLFRFNILMD